MWKGYRDWYVPAMHDPDSSGIASALLREWVRFGQIDSTNLEAKRRVADGAEGPGFVLTAERQTGGLGRRGKAWLSPEGGLWMTIALRGAACDQRLEGLPENLGLRVGAACLGVIREAAVWGGMSPAKASERVRLKWPNDVLIDRRKVCGVLCEVVWCGGEGWVIVGVGINANNRAAGLQGVLQRGAIGLAEVVGEEVDLQGLGMRIVESVVGGLTDAVGGGADGVPRWLEEARGGLFGVGESVEVSMEEGGPVWRGKLSGLDGGGFPLVRLASGEVRRVGAGEVLRFADDGTMGDEGEAMKGGSARSANASSAGGGSEERGDAERS